MLLLRHLPEHPALVCLLLATLALALFGTGPARAQNKQDGGEIPPPPLIPREVLFGNPDRASPQISPDGSKLAYLAPVEGVLNVWVGPANDISAAKPVTQDRLRGIRAYAWTYAPNTLLYIQDKNGDENWHVYATNVDTVESRDLTPIEGVRAEIEEVSYKFPTEILVGLNQRNPQFHDIYRLDIVSGEMTLILENPGFAGFLTDDEYNIRFGMRMTDDGGQEYLKFAEDAEWEPWLTIPQEDSLTTYPIGFDKTGQQLYFVDSRGRNTAALTVLNLPSGTQEPIADNPRSDVAGVMAHPVEKTIQAVAFNYLRREWQPLDPVVEHHLDVLRKIEDGDVEIISRTLDDQTWVAAYLVDNGPVRYYLYNRATEEAKFLFTNRPALEDLPLVRMHPVIVKSRDGLDLVSYLSLPLDARMNDDRKSANPLPMVLLVHGGPWARSTWGYDPQHQWFANRGYAVLDVNFRGSTGFGKEFINAANREWGAKMQEDLIDGVKWAVGEGIADPDRAAIYGGSYGGYAALAGLTFTPEVFACGVSIVGPSSLVTLLNSLPPYWEPMVQMFVKRVGDHRTEEGREFLLSRSPLTHVGNITRPLLIGQGANDPRVKQQESEQIVEAMEEKDIPVTYVLFPDEGHGFARPENRLAFYAVAEAFLAEQLGGRFEPVDGAFKGSSIKVPVGAQYVPELAEHLNKTPEPNETPPSNKAPSNANPQDDPPESAPAVESDSDRYYVVPTPRGRIPVPRRTPKVRPVPPPVPQPAPETPQEKPRTWKERATPFEGPKPRQGPMPFEGPKEREGPKLPEGFHQPPEYEPPQKIPRYGPPSKPGYKSWERPLEEV